MSAFLSLGARVKPKSLRLQQPTVSYQTTIIIKQTLPSHEQFSNHFELSRRKTLGENVGTLFQSGDVFRHDSLFFSNVGAEEMTLEGQILILGRHLGNIDEAEASLIVFKDCGTDKTLADEF